MPDVLMDQLQKVFTEKLPCETGHGSEGMWYLKLRCPSCLASEVQLICDVHKRDAVAGEVENVCRGCGHSGVSTTFIAMVLRR